jgi:hypothetical protein
MAFKRMCAILRPSHSVRRSRDPCGRRSACSRPAGRC